MLGWPSAAERRELGAFPARTGPEDVGAFFELPPDDLRFARTHRGEARLGVAVQLCSLRWLGFVPENLAELPQPALLSLCEQLEADPDDLALCGTRDQTRSDHFLAVRDRAGFKAFDTAERARLEEWLVHRAMEHERPKALHTLTCEQLRASRVVRPTVDVLVRLIGAAREAAHAATSEALAPQLSRPSRPGELDGLLDLREPSGVTWLEWIRTPAPDSAPAAIGAQLAKFEHLGSLGAEGVDLSMLAPGRVRILAADARRRSAWEIARLSATRRHPLLLVFIAEMLRERGDELMTGTARRSRTPSEPPATRSRSSARQPPAPEISEAAWPARSPGSCWTRSTTAKTRSAAPCAKSASSVCGRPSRTRARWRCRSSRNAATRCIAATATSRSSRPG